MIYLDTLLVCDLVLLCYSVLLPTSHNMLISFALPILAFVLITLISVPYRTVKHLSKCARMNNLTSQKSISLRAAIFQRQAKQSSITETEAAAQPLIQPTSTVLSIYYGTNNNSYK